MLLPCLDDSLRPEADRARGAAAGARAQVLEGLVKEEADWLGGRRAGEGLVDRLAPELHAQLAYDRVRDDFGEADEFEVEGTQGEVRILGPGREQPVD